MRIVVVGTGTEIGKTHLTCCLLAQARHQGLSVAAYKPVASGVPSDGSCEDARLHGEALGAPYRPPTFAYRPPISPHLAARKAQRPIELPAIIAELAAIEQHHQLVIVETAGGLFTPLRDDATNLDLVRLLLPAAILLVAPDRLGVLHDVGACRLAAQAGGLGSFATVLSAVATADASTGSNGAELDRLGWGPVLASLPRADYRSPASLAQAQRILASLGIG